MQLLVDLLNFWRLRSENKRLLLENKRLMLQNKRLLKSQDFLKELAIRHQRSSRKSKSDLSFLQARFDNAVKLISVYESALSSSASVDIEPIQLEIDFSASGDS